MKRILLFIPVLLLLYACPPREDTTEYHPIFMNRSILESSVNYQHPRALETPGKIYHKDNKIFISERYKGVHVINNKDPENPVPEAFISAAGCVDMAIKNNILYLDNAVDLIAIDLTNRQLVKRVKNVFPEPYPPDLNDIPDKYLQGNRTSDDLIIVGWKLPD